MKIINNVSRLRDSLYDQMEQRFGLAGTIFLLLALLADFGFGILIGKIPIKENEAGSTDSPWRWPMRYPRYWPASPIPILLIATSTLWFWYRHHHGS